MKTSHKALIFGFATELITSLWFLPGASESRLTAWLFLLHIPAMIFLFFDEPLFLAIAIEAFLWVLFWLVVISIWERRIEPLTALSLTDQKIKLAPDTHRRSSSGNGAQTES